MTANEVRAMFATLPASSDPDVNARREFLREFLTNDEFRRKVTDHSFKATR